MATVSDFVQDEATVIIEGGDEPTRVTYQPTKVTAAATAQLQRYIEDNDALAFARHVCKVFTSWTLKGPLYADVPVRDEFEKIVVDKDGTEVTERKLLVEEGNVIPLTPDVLQYVPQKVLSFFWREIQDDMTPDPQTARGSRKRS